MRVIKKRVPAKTVVLYQCKICRANHTNRLEAKKCEMLPTESKVFKLGDRVRNITARRCRLDKYYYFKGKIFKIKGPTLNYIFGQEHVFYYFVEYKCPICNKNETQLYQAGGLKKIS